MRTDVDTLIRRGDGHCLVGCGLDRSHAIGLGHQIDILSAQAQRVATGKNGLGRGEGGDTGRTVQLAGGGVGPCIGVISKPDPARIAP